ncbi:MAG: metal-dependent hydrolase [Desulfamplus sp.]
MTGPTHVAIAVTCGILAGAGRPDLALLAGGAVLPDLDHPQSFIGRVFFPVSIPLSNWLGHRGAFHSFWLWGLVAFAGFFWKPFFVLGAGALLHVFADCATVSGVRAMSPFTQKLFVLFQRSWRIRSGGKSEIIILLAFGSLAWAGGYIGTTGGIRALIGHLTGSPKIMLEEYRIKGLTKCYVDGKFRWNSGDIEENVWLIVGSEGTGGLALQGKNKIIHVPADGQFLKARLKPTEEKWQYMRLGGWAATESAVYFLDGSKWHYASAGSVVFGQIIGDKLVFRSF